MKIKTVSSRFVIEPRVISLVALLIVGININPSVSAEQPIKAQSNSRVLFGFDEPEAVEQWQIVNDGVMGGLSRSGLSFVDEGNVRFTGNLSLENNGGFASVRSKQTALNLSTTDVIVARVRGDGRQYMLNLYKPERRTAFSYRAEFDSTRDKWIEVRLPVSKFVATSFGRPVDGEQLDVTQINSIGVMLADKTPGEFELIVDWIKVESSK